MEIKIQEIPPEGLLLTFQEDPGPWGLAEKGLTISGLIQVLLKVIKHNENEVYIRGSLSADLLSECSRCLKKFSEPVQSDFHVEYVPLSKTPSEQERMLMKEDLDLQFYQGDAIEVREVIEGQLFLVAPMRPLCQPDCRGLCPHCGEDLNRVTCSCPPEPTDLRWADLKDLFKKGDR